MKDRAKKDVIFQENQYNLGRCINGVNYVVRGIPLLKVSHRRGDASDAASTHYRDVCSGCDLRKDRSYLGLEKGKGQLFRNDAQTMLVTCHGTNNHEMRRVFSNHVYIANIGDNEVVGKKGKRFTRANLIKSMACQK